jgi:hypothetical protein
MSRQRDIVRSSQGTSMCLAPAKPSEGPAILTFPIFGPKRPGKHSPGFTLGNSPARISPERAAKSGENRLRTFEPDRLCISSPFRAKGLFWLTQGKPWYVSSASHAMLRRGLRTQPRVSTLETDPQTRALKGRQIKRTKRYESKV